MMKTYLPQNGGLKSRARRRERGGDRRTGFGST